MVRLGRYSCRKKRTGKGRLRAGIGKKQHLAWAASSPNCCKSYKGKCSFFLRARCVWLKVSWSREDNIPVLLLSSDTPCCLYVPQHTLFLFYFVYIAILSRSKFWKRFLAVADPHQEFLTPPTSDIPPLGVPCSALGILPKSVKYYRDDLGGNMWGRIYFKRRWFQRIILESRSWPHTVLKEWYCHMVGDRREERDRTRPVPWDHSPAVCL